MKIGRTTEIVTIATLLKLINGSKKLDLFCKIKESLLRGDILSKYYKYSPIKFL